MLVTAIITELFKTVGILLEAMYGFAIVKSIYVGMAKLKIVLFYAIILIHQIKIVSHFA